MKKNIKKVFAWIRIWVYGFCPECNSSAPEIFDCPVCNYDTKSPFTKKSKKSLLWRRYKIMNMGKK